MEPAIWLMFLVYATRRYEEKGVVHESMIFADVYNEWVCMWFVMVSMPWKGGNRKGRKENRPSVGIIMWGTTV